MYQINSERFHKSLISLQYTLFSLQAEPVDLETVIYLNFPVSWKIKWQCTQVH